EPTTTTSACSRSLMSAHRLALEEIGDFGEDVDVRVLADDRVDVAVAGQHGQLVAAGGGAFEQPVHADVGVGEDAVAVAGEQQHRRGQPRKAGQVVGGQRGVAHVGGVVPYRVAGFDHGADVPVVRQAGGSVEVGQPVVGVGFGGQVAVDVHRGTAAAPHE